MSRPPIDIGTAGNVSFRGGEGKWVADGRVRCFDGSHKRIRRTGATKAAAMRAFKLAAQAVAPSAGSIVTPDTKVSVLASMWWSSFKVSDAAPKTKQRYSDAINPANADGRTGFIINALGEYRLRELKTSTLVNFLNALETKHGSSNAKMCRTVLIHILDLAVRDDALPENLARNTKPPKITVKPIETYSEAELHTILQTLYGNPAAYRLGVADIVAMLCATGCRIGEALALKWTDIDFEGNPMTLTINENLVALPGKGMVLQPAPKSEYSRRALIVPTWFGEVLLRRKRDDILPNQWGVVFPSATNTLKSDTAFRKQLKKYLPNFDPARVRPHTFRKSVATQIEHGFGMGAASRQLGHSTEAVTRKHYVKRRTQADDVREVLERFGEGLNVYGQFLDS